MVHSVNSVMTDSKSSFDLLIRMRNNEPTMNQTCDE